MVGALMVASASVASAQAPAPTPPPALAPSEIVAAAPASDWVGIAPEDLIVMTLAPDPRGGAGRTGERRVVIQLMPTPFSQGWVGNIRTLARARWWDGLAITRVQDNYVTQWGDPDGEDPAKARALPPGLRVMGEADYWTSIPNPTLAEANIRLNRRSGYAMDAYSRNNMHYAGWPIAFDHVSVTPIQNDKGESIPVNSTQEAWPVHCYGMVGVGRNLSPDTGTGAELYTVIGHAPRHLDRNIALVGRVVEGMEHLSSLARGTGPLGFYESAEERTGIASIRLASDLPATDQPRFEYLSTESETFARYAEARANRRDPFFNVPAGGADICNIPVPVRRVQSPG
jgi:peptidylprolyl isomerase